MNTEYLDLQRLQQLPLPELAGPAAGAQVWRAALDAPGWPDARRLPAEERERAQALLRPRSRGRWVASRWALRQVLGALLDESPGQIALRRGEDGKPRLAADPRRLRFNLSHSGSVALVAVSADHEVGVDVEEIKDRRNLVAIAERALAPEAAAAVRAAPPAARAAAFCERWTRHEARLKCLGRGLATAGPRPSDEVAVGNLRIGPGYAAALAVSATLQEGDRPDRQTRARPGAAADSLGRERPGPFPAGDRQL